MKCGHCQTYGVSVSHVRECSTGRTIQAAVYKAEPVTVSRRELGIPAPVTEPGVYFDGERYYKVVESQQGRLYAKVWDAEWLYDRGAINRLTADMKVTAEQAARFGKLWGSCVFCSRLLTDERSVAVGYGPVCAEHNGLPWGEVVAV